MEPKGLLMISAVLVGGFFALTSLKGAKIELPDMPAGGGMVSLTGKPLPHEPQGQGKPADYLAERAWGVIAEGPVISHDRGAALFIEDAFADWRPASKREVVGQVQLLLPRTDCAMSSPAEGSYLVNLLVSNTETMSGLYTFNQEELLKGVRKWFENIRIHGGVLPGPMANHEFRVHDVAITETERPVHVVLQNAGSNNQLYNFHLAPGARVSGVSMIGGGASAVANLPDDTPVEVIDGPSLSACGLNRTNRALALYAAGPRNSPFGERRSDEEIAEATAEAEAKLAKWNAWFRAQFGVSSDETLIGYHYAEASLIGPQPAPDARVAYRSLTGAHVTAQTERYFKLAGLHKWPEAYQAEVVALGTQLAGGDPRETILPTRYTEAY